MRVLVTGGAGFIGSNFVHCYLAKHPTDSVVVLDKLTYAGNVENLLDIENDSRYSFVKGDICDMPLVREVAKGCEVIVNFAAETHVDRSLMDPGSFVNTDVYGSYVLAEVAKQLGTKLVVQISTDEVYGSVEVGSSRETDPLNPSSPYSASKAGGEMMMLAYHRTYGLPVIITRGSNNFGPYQYPEKVIPVFITNAIDGERLPLYGDGMNVRDWIYVLDHCEAVDLVMQKGQVGEIYNIGGGNERANIEITKLILEELGRSEDLIQYVADRPGHDRRYSLDCTKIAALGWRPRHSFAEAMVKTVNWYQQNEWWWRKLKSGEYAEYYRRNYANR